MRYDDCPLPILGFCAFSGTGKTTLLSQLIPILVANGVRIAMIKHAHHAFDIDHPNKDSYRLRQAGAKQMLISSANRWALMHDHESEEDEASLAELIQQLDFNAADLILVEGFKKEPIAKIELHRPSLNLPLICEKDDHVIAIASDEKLDVKQDIPQLNLNNPDEIAQFILKTVFAQA
ncbi:MAG: molybdopterin-guanine dinucleotide biosynthesis protein B [Gammaproteobacteria bacterium]|jgi:molybdopterin-guanine dinucleotide biosynthesis protein B|nr:molybdopterin-guanine dinucleotide biosynthesis protein B [Gammaproteobacteria bacterium]|tara:strand:+ start:90341 stop:90874 length:534 start_codon:yes stop_codon:yes gene_type:complete